MIVLTVAHHLEARFLIEALDLAQIPAPSARPIFENESVRVVVSGIGSINATIGTTLALSSISPATPCAALNFGICGATSDLNIGSLIHVHSIRAASTGRRFYPDMILDLGLQQGSLETRDLAYMNDSSPTLSTNLVDMEAAGFFEAARSFLPPSRIFVLKLVSDHGQCFESIRDTLPELIKEKTAALRNSLRMIESWINAQQEFLPQQREALAQLSEQLRLTETQRQKLLFLGRAQGKESNLLTTLKPFLDHHYTHRQQRSEVFREIVDALSISLV